MERDGVAAREIEAIGRWTKRTWIAGLLLFVALLLSAPASALAGTAEEISALPTLDALNRSENPLSNGGKWTKLNWASTAGQDSTTGWIPASGFPTVNGAYWNPTTFTDTTGEAAALTMATVPGISERYISLWLDMSAPATAKSGYQLRWTVEANATTYTVKLAKWAAGTETVLASAAGVSIPAGQTLAIADTGGTVTAWSGSGGSLTQLLTATDSTYSSGYAGIEGSGSNSRSTNFKAGALVPPSPPPDTTITAGPKGLVVPNVAFSFLGTNSPTGFECALDSGSFEACSSPKPYSGLGEGSHAFRVRGLNGGGADATPAERSFQAVAAAKAVAKTPILDNFERSEVPLATGKFTKTSWASAIGGTWMGSYRGFGSSGGLAGAYWNQGTFGDGAEATVLVSGVVGTGATPAGQYLALWLDMPEPGNARSGYEARFTGTGTASSYTVELAKWVAGTRTVLATTSGFSLAVGTTMALTETAGGSLALWTGTTTLTPALTASDSTYSGGYAGLEVNGGAGTIYNFRAGRIDLTAPETTITSGPAGAVVPAEASFSFSSSEAGSSFECTLDATAFSACASPKSYSTATAGAHTFKVRAADSVGNQDGTPAERGFTIVPPPTVVTTAASGVKKDQASLTGTVNPNGAATSYQFEYGTTTAYGAKVPASPKAIGSGSTAVAASEPITGLNVATTYHYRLTATNGAGTSKGEDKTFTTAAAPTATTEAASEVSAAEAKLNASVNPNGAATSYQFEYGPTTAYGSKAPASAEAIGSGATATAVAKQITGLSEGSTYHYRVVAENEVGKAYGVDKTLETPLLPDATTEAAARINANEATLNAEVDSNGDPATYSFEYGTTNGYGSTAPSAGETAGEEGEARNATDSIRDLAPATTYHYRVVARSDAGTVKGVDKTFTTAARTKTPAEEAEQKQQEQNYDASKDKQPIGSDYMGMMWSGDLNKMATKNVSRAVYHSGARYLRQNFYPDPAKYPEAKMQKIIQEAAGRGVTILPYFGWGWPDENGVKTAWIPYITKMVNTYGPGGTYWANNGGAADMPIKVWEIGNEPNLGGNGPYAEQYRTIPLTKAEIEGYGKRFAEASAAAKAAAAGKGGISILLSGLFSTSPTKCTEGECHTDAGDFIRDMGANGSYDAISLHPYVLALGKDHDKLTVDDAERVSNITHKKVVEAREALEEEGEGGKGIWITEIGWATANEKTPKLSPPVSEPTQRKLIESTFEMLKADHTELGINHVFYYNIQDNPLAAESGSHEKRNWDHFSGLRRASGKKKEGWLGFTKVAKGDPWWPNTETAKKRPADNVKGKSGRLNLLVNSDGSAISGRFQIWKKEANPTVVDVAPFETEGEEGDELVSGMATGLQPLTTYVFHGVVTNEEEQTVVSENEEFTTPPSTSTSTNVTRVLHGQPGWVWVDGWVKEGEITGPLPGLSNVHVHVRLYRNGQFQRFVDVMTNGEGHYDSGYMEVGKGDWEVSTEFPGGGEWDSSETIPRKTFTVRDGVRIRAQYSNGCWDIFGAQQQNGAAVMHGACNQPPSSNQVFELKPQEGGQYLNIVARNSGRCVDVDNVSTADGAGLQQYDCLGVGWPNQLFREAWSGNYLSYVAKHSNKCVDVTGANPGWINLQQWTCNASTQQAFYLEPIESGPKPTETFISTSHLIHGNGQFGNSWGKITASGHLLAGAWPMQNRVVQVEFEKLVGGNYVRIENRAVTVNPDGSYELLDFALAPGIWRVRAEFIGDGEYQGSASGWHDFSIFQANRLVARHSGKCLSLSENKNVNGQHLIQWDCAGTGSLGDGQTFWFWPAPGHGPHVYEITVISSGKCLDIANGSTANGAVLQQWDCNGYGQQLWELLELAGQPGYYALRPLHSGKCLDVAGASTGNGAEVWQWDCHWGGNQQWILYGVVGG